MFHKNDIGSESAPSVSSYKSSATGKSKISRTSSRQAMSHKNSRSAEEFDKTGKIIELDNDDSDNDYNSSHLGSTGEFEMLQKMVFF